MSEQITWTNTTPDLEYMVGFAQRQGGMLESVYEVLPDRDLWIGATERFGNPSHSADLLGLTVDSHVGRMCVTLISETSHSLDMLREHGETDVRVAIISACVSQMGCWLFG